MEQEVNMETRKGHKSKDAPVVMLTTSKTTTTRVLPVLSYTTVSSRNMSAVFASVGEPGRHFI